MEKRNKIGILTWHYFSNFGSALQAYALQKTIENLGYDVEIINYHDKKYEKIKGLKYCIKNALWVLSKTNYDCWIFRRLGINTFSFQKRYLKQSEPFSDILDLPKYTEGIRTMVYGSDQIWAPNVFNPIYMGEGVPNNVNKVSYAASIGLRSLSEETKKKYANLLKSFSEISVREDSGRVILKSIGIEGANVVLDPTLLINVSHYKNLEKKVEIKSKNFIFCYFLNGNHNYWETVRKYAEKHDCIIVGVSANHTDEYRMKVYKGLGADQFLWLINNSYAVFTDSYHGSIFSILYHKNFYLFKRFNDKDPISQNSRIEQLIETFKIDDRLINQDSILRDVAIDYDKIEEKLRTQRDISIDFLRNALVDNA